ncbi:O-antigen ligase family protein [Flagellimonas profundi]|uniref:O-antigen ligase family protein n=1 Tax=Flagellimonas profundi TaxID=2915620 RepID=A0ABS3FBJ4_9FLAO|nr:O-antigen ligase family protein [Allomuricauda profundi]MBO0340530.1 O-antigen ligase family protein [Allomuricauda profundi]
MLEYFGPKFGSISSYLTSLLLVIFFFFTKKSKPLYPFVYLGLLYFVFASFNYTDPDINNFFLKELIRFMVVVICGAELARNSKYKELYFILLIGAISIIVNALIFPTAQAGHFQENYGRFSGFYLNPNTAGSVCLVGFAISFSIANRNLKLIGQFLLTLAGILTFSRTFILIWVIINLFAILQSKKNLLLPLVGTLVLILIFTFSNKLTLNAERFTALKSIFGSEQVDSKTINEDSRTHTWSLYYDKIMDHPFFGNGWRKFSGRPGGLPGVHNTYLLVIGEAGFIPFIILLGIYIFLLAKSLRGFKIRPELFYISLVISLTLMASHTYFSNFYLIFLSMFVFAKLIKSPHNSLVSNTNDDTISISSI